jgi:hypothetical protein
MAEPLRLRTVLAQVPALAACLGGPVLYGAFLFFTFGG